MIDPGLVVTLTRLAALLADARQPWWVIGSAAVALHGADVRVARDVDVLVDAADLPMLAGRTGVSAERGVPDARFWSAQLLRLATEDLAIEVFAGLAVRDAADGWQPLTIRTRKLIGVGDDLLPVPERAELMAILELFGRPKDLRRAALLRG